MQGQGRRVFVAGLGAAPDWPAWIEAPELFEALEQRARV
ncbi:hypothetical protein PPSIR1_06216 [Plesiocystis pacifica SIR-1]|uniref:Uncharacterized protein n=1 Tax=Plesiocystis pacifica SIR-1 TaxID=391625 RepID=A6G6W8_9BACT|nr:hypothetical protein PPSIR1_06216 [Plesiocystis pacifica SIR-1]